MGIFFQDPWWLIVLKVLLLFVILLVWTIFNVWYERRLVAKMQHRLGPIMNGPFGLGQAVADGAKLLLKEDFRPAKADPIIFNLAPFLTVVASFVTWTVLPIGGQVTIFGYQTRLQVTDLPVAVLFVIGIASIGIYGIVLAGWASNSIYSMMGSLRSTAQMISYEIAMGLSMVGVFMFSGSMSTHQIVEAQSPHLIFFNLDSTIPGRYWILLFPSFVIYAISMVAETNRAPFDLPECESELVSGYITEYSGFRYACFFLAEYINMVTVSGVCTTLFLGGYLPIWPLNLIGPLNNPWFGPLFFIIKVQFLFSVFVWLRGTLPRFRYDHLMSLGWKWLIPISLVWIMLIATWRSAVNQGWLQGPVFFAIIGLLLVVVVASLFWPSKKEDAESGKKSNVDNSGPFDAFAGGYPVPPMPGQVLPEIATKVSPVSAGEVTKEEVKS